jgi:hypothetical protein
LLNYVPYPLAAPAAATDFIHRMCGRSVGQDQAEPRPNPTRPGDQWRQEWAVNEINSMSSSEATATFNIMPSTPDISVNTMNLVAIYSKKSIQVSTFRQFTLHGDIVRYDPRAIKYYEWYLVKTGYQGTRMADRDSQENYQKILDFVEKGGLYHLVSATDLPDGSKLALYRRN